VVDAPAHALIGDARCAGVFCGGVAGESSVPAQERSHSRRPVACAILRGVTDQLTVSGRIGLNAHLLSQGDSYRSAGINGYIWQLLHHLPAASSDLRYTAYLREAFSPPDGIVLQRSKWDTRHPWRRILWEQARLPLLARSHALVHGLAYAVPLAAPCPTVVTIHDLSFMRFPDAFRPANRIYLSWMTRKAARRSARIVAVSESTRRDVIRFCDVPADRVVAIPNGVTAEFCPADSSEVRAFRERKGLPERFMLFLGTLEPRKNLVRLLEAYDIWRRRKRSDVKLVVAGAKGWFYDQIFSRCVELGLQDHVLFPGFIPPADLPWWYRAAELFVYPSLFEGFGLPVLEAMACGTPTITSDVSSLPEVAGDAALLVDPTDTQALAAAFERVLDDPIVARDLGQAGIVQAGLFSWARTALATVAVYRAVLGEAA